MIGFAVSTVAVILAAWFGYAAGRASRPRVPAGTTHTGHCYPQDCDHDCPQSILRSPEAQAAERARLKADAAKLRAINAIADTTGWLDTPGDLRAHVDRDDRIYGRNG